MLVTPAYGVVLLLPALQIMPTLYPLYLLRYPWPRQPFFCVGFAQCRGFYSSCFSNLEWCIGGRTISPSLMTMMGRNSYWELSTLYSAYAESSALECITFKAITVMLVLLLQKPYSKSKPKEHSLTLMV